MNLPPLDLSTTHLGPWIGLEDVEPVVIGESHKYHTRFAKYYVGDEGDLAQTCRLRLWEWSVTNGHPERIRELEAFALIRTAIGDEIEATRRLRHCDVAQDEVDWTRITQIRPSLTRTQRHLLSHFQQRCAECAEYPHWEVLFLRDGCGWEPREIERYFRSRNQKRRRLPAAKVPKIVAVAKERIRICLDRRFIDEINHLDFIGD